MTRTRREWGARVTGEGWVAGPYPTPQRATETIEYVLPAHRCELVYRDVIVGEWQAPPTDPRRDAAELLEVMAIGEEDDDVRERVIQDLMSGGRWYGPDCAADALARALDCEYRLADVAAAIALLGLVPESRYRKAISA